MIILLLGSAIPISAQQQQQSVRLSFERLAGEIKVLGPDEFIYGFRETSRIPPRDREPVRQFTALLESRPWRSTDFLSLLKHSEAKVRTLTLIALYNLEDPAVLPNIFSLVKDGSPTFASMRRFASFYSPDAPLTAEMTEPQTVGKIAEAILNVYLESGGYHYGPLGLHGQPGFKEYWQTHARRSTSASWWHVRLARASHSTSPTLTSRYAAIKRLRAEIDKLREPDRTFTLLRLKGEIGIGSDVLVSDEELIALLRKLGSDNLVDLLRRKIRSDDPDLQPNANNHSAYAGMCLFVLRNSAALLRAHNADTLLVQEAWERDFQKHNQDGWEKDPKNHKPIEPLINPWWAIGAAQLNREQAPAILHQAYARFQRQYDSAFQLELAQALWRIVGEDQAATVADWIYKELARPMGLESNMLDKILGTESRRNLVLVQTLIRHPQFDQLNWKSLDVLARRVNFLLDKTIIPVEDLDSAWSPMGTDFFMNEQAKALQQYPKEMGELSLKLARWRQALRHSLQP
jgi:hypothetical protein